MARFRLLRAGRRVTAPSLAIAAVSLATVFGGCGDTEKATAGTRTTNAAAVAGAKTPRVALHVSEGSYSLTSSSATIHGTATKGALVTANGRAAAVHQGHWRATLQLHIGDNSVRVIATMPGRTSSTDLISITRHHSPAELEAKARARVLRAEAERRHEAEARDRRERKEHEQQAAQQRRQALSECTNGTYVNTAGNTVCKPVESSTQPAGATAECEDGTYSFSESRSGTCSHHGGVRTWLDE
jgi:hypothetical protein